MPISREEFEAGRADLTLPVLKFLEDGSESAYTAEEIRHTLTEELQKDILIQDICQALNELVETGYVEVKEIAGIRWYAIIQKRIGFH